MLRWAQVGLEVAGLMLRWALEGLEARPRTATALAESMCRSLAAVVLEELGGTSTLLSMFLSPPLVPPGNTCAAGLAPEMTIRAAVVLLAQHARSPRTEPQRATELPAEVRARLERPCAMAPASTRPPLVPEPARRERMRATASALRPTTSPVVAHRARHVRSPPGLRRPRAMAPLADSYAPPATTRAPPPARATTAHQVAAPPVRSVRPTRMVRRLAWQEPAQSHATLATTTAPPRGSVSAILIPPAAAIPVLLVRPSPEERQPVPQGYAVAPAQERNDSATEPVSIPQRPAEPSVPPARIIAAASVPLTPARTPAAHNVRPVPPPPAHQAMAARWARLVRSPVAPATTNAGVAARQTAMPLLAALRAQSVLRIRMGRQSVKAAHVRFAAILVTTTVVALASATTPLPPAV
jgi:hypothetical protein